MKTIGLLGGTSWPSTLDYYATLNRMVAEKLGGFHSAQIILKSMDYHAIKSCYGKDWSKVPPLLEKEIHAALALKPDIFLICNNTLHKALDEISIDFGPVKLIHMIDETGKAAREAGYQKILLLGTKTTMEDGSYARKLENFGLHVDVPNLTDRDLIQMMQPKLAAGDDPEPYKEKFKDLLARYPDYDAVVLACTELPLVVNEQVTSLPILNPTFLQCRAAVTEALS